MASANKTEYLGLNSWIASDTPKREDFVNDNLLIDEAVKNHVEDDDRHVSAELKEVISTLADEAVKIKVLTYSGNGSTIQSIDLGDEPLSAAVFAAGRPPVMLSDSVLKIYSAFLTPGGMGGGLSLSGSSLRVIYNKTASSGLQYCLNESGVSYVIVMWYR